MIIDVGKKKSTISFWLKLETVGLAEKKKKKQIEK